MAHVPPDDSDFDPRLAAAYAHTLAAAPKLVFALNGHRHSFRIGETFRDGVTFINSFSFNKDQYLILTVWNDADGQPKYRLQKVAF